MNLFAVHVQDGVLLDEAIRQRQNHLAQEAISLFLARQVMLDDECLVAAMVVFQELAHTGVGDYLSAVLAEDSHAKRVVGMVMGENQEGLDAARGEPVGGLPEEGTIGHGHPRVNRDDGKRCDDKASIDRDHVGVAQASHGIRIRPHLLYLWVGRSVSHHARLIPASLPRCQDGVHDRGDVVVQIPFTGDLVQCTDHRRVFVRPVVHKVVRRPAVSPDLPKSHVLGIV